MADDKPTKRRATRLPQLPWKALREEWQTTNVAFASLARRHGVPTSTISRCANAEGWVRDPEVRRKAAMDNLEEVSGKPARPPRGVVKVLKAAGAPADEPAIEPEDKPLTGQEKRVLVPVASPEAANYRHVRVGRELQETGKAILSTVRALFPDVTALAGDEAAMALALAKAQVAQQFAGMLNPSKETLASLAKAAADIVRAGVSVERVAMGLERPSGGARTDGGGRAVNVITNTSTVQTNNTQNIQVGEVGGPSPIPGLPMSAEVAHMVRNLARTLEAQKRQKVIEQQTGAGT